MVDKWSTHSLCILRFQKLFCFVSLMREFLYVIRDFITFLLFVSFPVVNYNKPTAVLCDSSRLVGDQTLKKIIRTIDELLEFLAGFFTHIASLFGKDSLLEMSRVLEFCRNWLCNESLTKWRTAVSVGLRDRFSLCGVGIRGDEYSEKRSKLQFTTSWRLLQNYLYYVCRFLLRKNFG